MPETFHQILQFLVWALPCVLGVVGILLLVSVVDGHRRARDEAGGEDRDRGQ